MENDFYTKRYRNGNTKNFTIEIEYLNHNINEFLNKAKSEFNVLIEEVLNVRKYMKFYETYFGTHITDCLRGWWGNEKTIGINSVRRIEHDIRIRN